MGQRAMLAAGRRSPPPSPFAPTEYARPTPPPRSGYHRYQLRLYEQPEGERITLGPEERISAGEEQPCPGASLWVPHPSVHPEFAAWGGPRRAALGMSLGRWGGTALSWAGVTK